MSVYYRDDQVTLHGGDCLDVLAELPDNSVDAVVTDPPYGLEFMGKDWDRFGRNTGNHTHSEKPRFTSDHMGKGFDKIPNTYEAGRPFQQWCQQWAIECLRVLKPGGHLLAFGGTRTHHRLASAIEDAGFEIRDSIAWLYGSGFPKSLDVSKAIDKAAGAEREVLSTGSPVKRMIPGADQNSSGSWIKDNGREFTPTETAPATDAAQQWQGWGTALKPAFEPIVVARKPLRGTVAANVQAHGVGALNIDACRVEYEQGGSLASNPSLRESINGGNGGNVFPAEADRRVVTPNQEGRWPANVVLDGAMAGELDRQSGVLTSGANPTRRSSDKFRNAYGEFSGQEECVAHRGAESGGAARFFPTFHYTAKAATAQRPSADGVTHPTVKPLDLMRWLIRLVTPPHGVVLDPFAGSGTTGEAAIHEHMHAVLIEREPTYLPLIIARLSKPMEVGFDFDPVGEHIAATMFTPGGTAAYEPIPLTYDGEAPA